MNRKSITIAVDEEIYRPYTNDTKQRSLQNAMADNLNHLSLQNFVQSVWGLDPNYTQEILDHTSKISTAEYNQATGCIQTPETLDVHQEFRKMSSDLLKQICNTLSLDHQALDTPLWRGPGIVALRSGSPEPRAESTLDRSEHRTTGISIDGLQASLWYCDRTGGWRTLPCDFGTPEGASHLGLALFALSRYNMQQSQLSEKRQVSDATILSQEGFLLRKPAVTSAVASTLSTTVPSCKTIRVVPPGRYKNIWQATSTDEFKRVYLDCMRGTFTLSLWDFRTIVYSASISSSPCLEDQQDSSRDR